MSSNFRRVPKLWFFRNTIILRFGIACTRCSLRLKSYHRFKLLRCATPSIFRSWTPPICWEGLDSGRYGKMGNVERRELRIFFSRKMEEQKSCKKKKIQIGKISEKKIISIHIISEKSEIGNSKMRVQNSFPNPRNIELAKFENSIPIKRAVKKRSNLKSFQRKKKFRFT